VDSRARAVRAAGGGAGGEGPPGRVMTTTLMEGPQCPMDLSNFNGDEGGARVLGGHVRNYTDYKNASTSKALRGSLFQTLLTARIMENPLFMSWIDTKLLELKAADVGVSERDLEGEGEVAAALLQDLRADDELLAKAVLAVCAPRKQLMQALREGLQAFTREVIVSYEAGTAGRVALLSDMMQVVNGVVKEYGEDAVAKVPKSLMVEVLQAMPGKSSLGLLGLLTDVTKELDGDMMEKRGWTAFTSLITMLSNMAKGQNMYGRDSGSIEAAFGGKAALGMGQTLRARRGAAPRRIQGAHNLKRIKYKLNKV
jgi:hypothetical protein